MGKPVGMYIGWQVGTPARGGDTGHENVFWPVGADTNRAEGLAAFFNQGPQTVTGSFTNNQ
jgi:hypothetical protein